MLSHPRSTGGRMSIHSVGPSRGNANRATLAVSGSTPLRRMSSRSGSIAAALSKVRSIEDMWTSFELQNSSEYPGIAAGSGRKGETGIG